MIRIIAALLLAVNAVAGPAGQQAEAGARVDAAMALFDKGRYLDATDALAAAAFAPDGTVRDDYAFQMWAQVSPTITGEIDPAVADRGAHAPPDPSWAARVAAAVPRDALAEIVRRARDTRVVILNEAHTSPRDRAFALEVARALRPLGYSVLAAEAFANDPPAPARPTAMELLVRDGFARFRTGFYVRDPVYAGFVRGAMAIGYVPVAYEQTAEQSPADGGIDAREQAQAENLSAILAAKPSAKLLVYVGYLHAAEAPTKTHGAATPWMAARLKRMTGIDPLTIDQTTLTDVSAAARPAYALVAGRIGARAAVLFEGDRPLVLGEYAGAVDLQVVHPRRDYAAGRPTWLGALGGRPRPVPAALLPRTGRRLVQAFAAAAPADAVPLDQVLVRAGSPPPALMLPPGPVRFAVQP